MRIDEPTTFATDLALALLADLLAVLLLRAGVGPGRGPARTWGLAFLALGAGSLFGGVEHGLGPSLGPEADALLWRGALLFLGAAALLVLLGALGAAFPPPLRGRLSVAGALLAGGGTLAVVVNGAFAGAVALYGGDLAAVLAILFLAPACRGSAARWWVLAGCGVSALAAWIQQYGPDLHPSFNHNDLYHCLQAPGLWLLYRGGLLLREPAA